MQAKTHSNLVSVVIICRNAADHIDRTIRSALLLSDDVVLLDTGSTDDTLRLVRQYQVRLYEQPWQGYGATKNTGNELAKYPWIMSMDADEEINKDLVHAIQQADLRNERSTFQMQRLSYLGSKAIRHGAWGNSYVTRLFNRNNAAWDRSEVHEELVYQQPPHPKRLKGILHHYTAPGIGVFRQKLGHYANLMADKYLAKGKKAGQLKILLSPTVQFIQQYLLKAGFLDGREGWQIAKANAWYTFRKYKLLRQKQAQQQQPS